MSKNPKTTNSLTVNQPLSLLISTCKPMMLPVEKIRKYFAILNSYLLTSARATRKYCDTLLVEWLGNTEWTKEMECHDCILGTMQTQLKSPLDYTEEYAEDFASLTSSCGSTQYTLTTPTSYALGTRSQDAPLPTPTCKTTYAVKSGDTCNSISEVNKVSTFGITNRNSLYSDCSNLAGRSTICIPDQCTIYKVKINETCDSIIEKYGNGISGAQFLAWNPNINDMCLNVDDLIDTYICLRYVHLGVSTTATTFDANKSSRRSSTCPNANGQWRTYFKAHYTCT